MALSPTATREVEICGKTINLNPFKIFICVLMVITGSFNTLSVKWADRTSAINSAGECTEFNHPFLQANFMMVGEMLCMVAFLVYWACGGLKPDLPHEEEAKEEDKVEETEGKGKVKGPNPFLFLPPALLDVTATSAMYVGLTKTSAASFQMIRGSIMIFVGLLSIPVLKKRLKWFQWLGMAVIFTGIFAIGLVDFFYPGKKSHGGGKCIADMKTSNQTYLNSSSPLCGPFGSGPCNYTLLTPENDEGSDGFTMDMLVGDLIILCAQVVAACQFVYEEKYVIKYNQHPLKVVGSEGIFGFIALALLQIPLYFIIIQGFQPGYNPDGRIEDPYDGFVQIFNEPQILGGLLVMLFSIATFNYAGVSITKYMGATTRKVLDTLRTFFIWMGSIALGWTIPGIEQILMQAVAFMLVATGMFLYSDVIIMPYIRSLRSNKKKQNS